MHFRKKPEPRPLLQSTNWVKPGDLPNALQETWPQLVFSKDKRHYWLCIAGRPATEWMPVSIEFIDSQWDNVVVPFDSQLHQEEEGTRVDIKAVLDPNSTIFRLIVKHLEYWGFNLRECDIYQTWLHPWATFEMQGHGQLVYPGNIVLTDVETGAVVDVITDHEELLTNYDREPDAAPAADSAA